MADNDVPRFFLPLSSALAREDWPEDRFATNESGGTGGVFDNVLCSDLQFVSESNALSIEVSLAFQTEIVVPLPLSEGTALVLGAPAASPEDGDPEPRVVSVRFDLGWPEPFIPGDNDVDSEDALDPEPEPEPEPAPEGPLPWRLHATLDILSLRFGRDLLKPVDVVTEGAEIEIVDREGHVEIQFGCALSIDDAGGIEFSMLTNSEGGSALGFSSAFEIGTSGVVLQVGELHLLFSPQAIPPVWAPHAVGPGVALSGLTIILPPDLRAGLLGSIRATNVVVTTGGFSGALDLTWPQALVEDGEGNVVEPPRFVRTETTAGVGDLFGMPFALRSLDFALKQNSFERAGLACDVIVPVFERPLGLELSIDAQGAFAAEVRTSTLLDDEESDDALVHLRQADLLDFKVESARFELKDGVGTFSMAGTLDPLVGGIDWPSLEIEKLSIDTNGKLDFDGGWVDLPTSTSLDFHAFKIDIKKFGFGTEHEGGAERHWLGVSGGLRIIEGIPLSATVEGLKVSWAARTGTGAYAPDIRAEIEGVGVHLEIPGTLILDGSVKYEEKLPPRRPAGTPDDTSTVGEMKLMGHVFTGSILLDIVALRMQVAGELLVGELSEYDYVPDPADSNFEIAQPRGSFTAFYIVLSAELPTALPLGATGAGLYGLKGLFGMHVAPNRLLDDEGEPEAWYSWYKSERGNDSEYNVTKVVKWAPRKDHFAFGAGLTIGTIFDDGFTVNVGALAAIMIPGPVIMIEGRANLLKQRTGSGQGLEGALYALIVFDGLAETFQMNVDINLSIEDVITVTGGLEAFFDFNDGSNWHVWIGQKPLTAGGPDKRIRAEILSIVTAKSYFMIDSSAVAFGAEAGVDLQLNEGPLEIKFILKLAFELAMTWRQPQLTGMIQFYLELAIRIFGIGIGLVLEAMLSASTPNPWWIRGKARAALSLPFPLPSFDVEVGFEWGQTGNPVLIDPLKTASFVHPKLPGKSWALKTLAEEADHTKWGVVPVDAIPVASFAKPLTRLSKDLAGEAVRDEQLEGRAINYYFTRLTLRKVVDGVEQPTAILDVADPDASDVRLRPDLSAQEPQVELWWYSPLDTYDKYSRENYRGPCLEGTAPVVHTVDFADVPVNTQFPWAFERGGLGFEELSTGQSVTMAVQAITSPAPQPGQFNRGLAFKMVAIRFSEPVTYLKLTWARTQANGGPGPYGIIGRHNGGVVALPSASSPAGSGPWSWEPLGPVGAPTAMVDTIVLGTPSDTYFALTSITWRTYADFYVAYDTEEVGPRSSMTPQLLLEPNTAYTLELQASRAVRDAGTLTPRVSEEVDQTIKYGFRTGGLPGTEYATAAPDFASSPLNDVGAYVKRTIPATGAPTFYRGYDALVEMADPYAHSMLAPNLGVRARDRNGVTQSLGGATFIKDGLPLLTPGLLRLLAAPRALTCAGGAPDPWTRELNDRYVACPLGWAKPQELYRIELTAPQAGGKKVFGFDVTTSRFLDAKEHLASGLLDATGGSSPRGTRKLRTLSSVALPSVNWLNAITNRRNAHGTARVALRDALTTTSNPTTALETAMTNVANARADVDAWTAWLYEVLDRGTTAAVAAPWDGSSVSYSGGGVHARFASAGMGHRPLPPKNVEALAVNTTGGYFILVESPEPIDWFRIRVTRESPMTPLPTIWSADGTRAFIFDTDVVFAATDSPVIRLSYARGGASAPDLDMLRRAGENENLADDIVTWVTDRT